MASVEAKKAEICALWGLPSSDIDNKMAQLKCIISDHPESLLLDYLLRADLNIERAIDLHFAAQTPTPSPAPQPQPIHNPDAPTIDANHIHASNHNQSNADELDLNELVFEDSDADGGGNQAPKESSEDIEVLNNADRVSTSPTNTESIVDPSHLFAFDFDDDSDIEIEDHNNNNSTNEDDLLVLSTNTNINNRNRGEHNRKRKRIDIEPTFFSFDEILEPMVKKRRLSIMNNRNNHDSESEEPQNTNNKNNHNNNNNHNHNNSSNEANHNHNGNDNERNAPPEPMDTDAVDEAPEAKHNPNWTKKVFGTLRFEYTETFLCSAFDTLYDFALAKRNRRLTIDTVGPHPIELDETKLRELYDHCLDELQYVPSKQTTGTISRVKRRHCLSDETEEDKKYEEALQKELDHIKEVATFPIWTNPELSRQITNLAESRVPFTRKPKRFCIEFEISFNRKRHMFQNQLILLNNRKEPTSFATESPYIIALLGGSKALADEIASHKRLIEDYTEKKHIYSMVSLLDYACRFDYDAEDTNANYAHELNIQLHQYQLQSLRWMMNEENDAIGFYRHLFSKGRFADRTAFYYSPLFDEIIINDTIPVAHGGFLCEEMGLGKTVISLALIQCNPPTDLSTYSTKKKLQIAHSFTERRFRYDYTDPTNPSRVPYDMKFTYYKSKATLIIAPVSLVGQWEKECDEKCVRKLKCKRYYGSNRSRDVRKYIDLDIIFTTYGILGVERGEDRVKHVLHQIEWHRIILDESHYIKNANCGSAKSINKLRAVNKWCLTGTPFGRQIYDIHNQLQFIGMKPAHLSKLDLKTVSKRKMFNGSNSAFGRSICRPLIGIMPKLVMRHKKAQKFNNEAIVELPEKEENVIMVEFTTKQREYYNKLYNTAKERYDYYKTINNIGRGSIAILASLHPARQACSGYLYSKDNIEQELSNAQARTFHIRNMVNSNSNLNLSRQELYEMAEDESFNDRDGECPICYECPFDEPLQTPCRHVFCGECIRAVLQDKQLCPMCRKPVYPNQLKKPKEDKKEEDDNHNQKENESNTNNDNNNNNNNNKGGSDKEEKEDENGDQIRFDSKLKVLINELKKIKTERPTEKSLIFTSFSKSLNWMCGELKKNGFEYRTLTGSMTMNKRKKQLNEFSNNPNVSVFVLSVRSGAVGITLTAANHVFMLEPPFNAALHRQAINRVYRLGQTKKVFIHTLIMKDSIEERIWNVNKDKQSGTNNSNVAGNICADKSAKLEQHEISKLFAESAAQ